MRIITLIAALCQQFTSTDVDFSRPFTFTINHLAIHLTKNTLFMAVYRIPFGDVVFFIAPLAAFDVTTLVGHVLRKCRRFIFMFTTTESFHDRHFSVRSQKHVGFLGSSLIVFPRIVVEIVVFLTLDTSKSFVVLVVTSCVHWRGLLLVSLIISTNFTTRKGASGRRISKTKAVVVKVVHLPFILTPNFNASSALVVFFHENKGSILASTSLL